MATDEQQSRPSIGRDLLFWLGLAGLFGLTALAGLLAWALAPALHPDWHSSVVSSESMAPRLRSGDVVLWHAVVGRDLGPGTVVVFPDPDGRRTVHRIQEVLPSGDLRTRGDANPLVDSHPVESSGVEGVARVLVPLVGTPNLWAHTGRTGHLAVLALGLLGLAWATWFVWVDDYDPWAGRGEGFDELAVEPLWLTAAVDAGNGDDDGPLVAPGIRALLLAPAAPR